MAQHTSASPLTINGGSSSIKFALYRIGEALERGFSGKLDCIGMSGTNLTALGAALMSASTVIVAINAQMLKLQSSPVNREHE